MDPSSVAPKSGVNTKLHAVTNAEGGPLSFFMTAGQDGDYTGAAVLLTIYARCSGCRAAAAMMQISRGTPFRRRT